jgi:MinD superfamily P-loop ATPase
MKKITITGGKGGVGKSTVAILLANKFVSSGKKIILCDLDVECPNDHLLLGQKLGKPTSIVSAQFPKLDKEKCQKCGLCVKTCYNHTIFQTPGGYPVFLKDLCSGCGACWVVCPYGAIKREKEKIGEIYLNKISKNFWLITGLTKPGIGKTGLVVTDFVVAETKKFAQDFAQKMDCGLILFDTMPGTHCPVISGISDSDFIYAVTEPTPMGAHDLGLILELCSKLKVPAKIVLNQADLGDKERTRKTAAQFKTPIEIEIPYSKKIAQAYSAGKLKEINLLN